MLENETLVELPPDDSGLRRRMYVYGDGCTDTNYMLLDESVYWTVLDLQDVGTGFVMWPQYREHELTVVPEESTTEVELKVELTVKLVGENMTERELADLLEDPNTFNHLRERMNAVLPRGLSEEIAWSTDGNRRVWLDEVVDAYTQPDVRYE